MASTFLNISTDNTLGGGGASDSIISSQKAIKDYIDSQVDGVETSEVTLATVATTGAYSDLSGKPNLSDYQTTANLVTSLSNASTDTQYPSAKCVYDMIGNIETLLSQV